MQQTVFIRLERTFEEAMYYRLSPLMKYFSFEGVQLLPNHPYPYIQRTYTKEGIVLESYTVYVRSVCGDTLQNPDISDYFTVVNAYSDPNTGLAQIDWSIDNCPFDYGSQLVYLEIQQGVSETFYSSPFYFTNDNADFSSRWDYRVLETTQTYSTGLKLWFKQYVDVYEQETYDPVYGSNRRAIGSKLILQEAWQTSIVDVHLFRYIKSLFHKNSYIYCDLWRTVLGETFDTPRLVADENFAEQEILLCRDESDQYDPLYVPPTPEPQPPIPSITLIEIAEASGNAVTYVNFTYANITPNTFLFQYSLDGETWPQGNASGTNAPQTISIGYGLNINQNLYYRIVDPSSGTISNVLQLPVRSITITNITSIDGAFRPNGNKYNWYFTLNNFTLPPNTAPFLSFYGSVDGVNWINLLYNNGNTSPKSVNTPSSGVEFTYFQIRFTPYGLVSNTFNFEF